MYWMIKTQRYISRIFEMNVCKLYKVCKYPFFSKKKKKQEFVDYLILDLVTYLEYLTVSCDDKLLRSYICMLASFLSLFWQIYKLKCYISTQYKTGFCPSYLSQLYLDPGLIYILVPGPMAKEHGEPLVPIGTTIQD